MTTPYVTREQADEYMATRLHSDAWNDASDDDKDAAIMTATRRIDMQRLRRTWTEPGDAPQGVKAACCEEALFLLSMTKGDVNRERRHALGMVGRSVGDANEYAQQSVVQAKAMGGVQLLSPEARQFLSPYIRRARIVPIV